MRWRLSGDRVRGASQEGGGRSGVTSLECRLSGRGDVCERSGGEPVGRGLIVAEFDAIPKRLLEVVAR